VNFCPKITDTYVYTNWTKKKREKRKNTEEEEPKETMVLSLRKIINLRRIVKRFVSVVLN